MAPANVTQLFAEISYIQSGEFSIYHLAGYSLFAIK